MRNHDVKRHIRKAASYGAVGGLGLVIMSALSGCDHRQEADNMQMQGSNQEQGYFIVIQETAPGTYQIVEQYPTPGTTRAILKKADGTEQLLSEEELKALSATEAKKVEEGTSRLTQPGEMQGMSLGEVILASAAGAIIGSWLGNKLFNNPNYQQRATKAPSSYSPKTTAPTSTTPQKKSSGYMKSSSSGSSFGFGG